jgi:O-acetyl-ADP-ribose deacetylase (regulator of RNase III)
MFQIEYKTGDLFKEPFTTDTLVPHVVNSCGGWGFGFVMAISNLSKNPSKKYREWYKTGSYHDIHHEVPFMLGEIQVVPLYDKDDNKIFIVNMIGQKDVGLNKYNMPPIRYECLEECLYKLKDFANKYKMPIRAPKFGAGLAGGQWTKIEGLILNVFKDSNIPFTVYDLK